MRAFFNSILDFFKAEPTLDPENYGWVLYRKFKWGRYYVSKCNGFSLSESGNDEWVFDKQNKKQPGIIARFDGPLFEEDFQHMAAVIERINAEN